MKHIMPTDKPQHICHHPGCNCAVNEGQWYCSDYCSNAAGKQPADSDQIASDGTCHCGHSDCSAEIQPERSANAALLRKRM
jgi:hypothetical protein